MPTKGYQKITSIPSSADLSLRPLDRGQSSRHLAYVMFLVADDASYAPNVALRLVIHQGHAGLIVCMFPKV